MVTFEFCFERFVKSFQYSHNPKLLCKFGCDNQSRSCSSNPSFGFQLLLSNSFHSYLYVCFICIPTVLLGLFWLFTADNLRSLLLELLLAFILKCFVSSTFHVTISSSYNISEDENCKPRLCEHTEVLEKDMLKTNNNVK